jgi:hypothetical protein
MRAGDASAAIDDLLPKLRAALDTIAVPDALALEGGTKEAVARTLQLCRERVEAFE